MAVVTPNGLTPILTPLVEGPAGTLLTSILCDLGR